MTSAKGIPSVSVRYAHPATISAPALSKRRTHIATRGTETEQ